MQVLGFPFASGRWGPAGKKCVMCLRMLLRSWRANGKATRWVGKYLFSVGAVRRTLPLEWRDAISLWGITSGGLWVGRGDNKRTLLGLMGSLHWGKRHGLVWRSKTTFIDRGRFYLEWPGWANVNSEKYQGKDHWVHGAKGNMWDMAGGVGRGPSGSHPCLHIRITWKALKKSWCPGHIQTYEVRNSGGGPQVSTHLRGSLGDSNVQPKLRATKLDRNAPFHVSQCVFNWLCGQSSHTHYPGWI